MQTSRGIHSEAASILYSELALILRPGDILCLQTPPINYGGKSPHNTWRHNPLHGGGLSQEDCQKVYQTSKMDGIMEPHIFAQFRKIIFHVDLHFNFHEAFLRIKEDLSIEPADEMRFIKFLQQSTLFKDFVKVLSISPVVDRLSVYLCVEVVASFDILNHLNDPSDERENMLEGAANERAVEILLDCGTLSPLRELSNVKSFKLGFHMLDRNNELYQPQPKHMEMAQKLKQTIEGNWLAKQKE